MRGSLPQKMQIFERIPGTGKKINELQNKTGKKHRLWFYDGRP
jgi:hypothetical protein